MKKLVCEKAIHELVKQGKKTLYIEPGTLVTAAAKDKAAEEGIEICEGKPAKECTEAATQQCCDANAESNDAISSDVIYSMVKSLLGQDVYDAVSGNSCDQPYCAEVDPSGVKLIRGATVDLEPLDTGNPAAKVCYREAIGKSDSSDMGSGFFEITGNGFECEMAYQEIDYVVEGSLTVSINGKTLTAHAGDIFFVPSGVTVVWGTPNKARVFYVAYPI